MRLDPGARFAGYEIVSRLGKGGMATVYLGREPGLERFVALKLLPEDLSSEPEFAARFDQEARVVASLDHPNIIPLFRCGIEQGTPWMALRYVDGGDLAARLAAGSLPQPEGLAILRAIASALDHAHERRVVHRDLKPQNILLTARGSAYLADFGIAKLLDGSAIVKTQTGGTYGTPSYMAPEQVQALALGSYTDVYALAVIAFQWLTGELPFTGDTPHAVLVKQVHEPVPSRPLAGLPLPVRSVLVRGLSKDPTQRIQAATQFVAELEAALEQSPRGVPARAEPEAVRPGDEFVGHTIVGRIGRGWMATAYLALDTQVGRQVALKLYPRALAAKPESEKQFLAVARTLAKLEHPHILPVYRFGVNDGFPWLSLRYAAGGTLGAALEQRGLARREVLRALDGVASALDFAHRRGIVHGDVKPENILFGAGGEAFLANFGIPELFSALKAIDPGLEFVGTPEHMAPEQALGHKLAAAGDIYSLGVIAFQWLTGTVPFEGELPHLVMVRHIKDPLPEAQLAKLSPPVRAVLEAVLAKQPARRPESATQFVRQLEEALEA